MSDKNRVVSHEDALEAGVVLECFLKRTELPVVDRDAVKRVHDALLSALLSGGEHSSLVLMSGEEKSP